MKWQWTSKISWVLRVDAESLLAEGYDALDHDAYREALRIFRHAFLLKPRADLLPIAYYGSASAYYWLDDYTKAQAYIQEAIRLDPKDARYPALLGHIYVDTGNKELARQVYTKLLRLDKKLADELLEAIQHAK